MQTYMFAAGVLALIVGAAHSVLGELLIFRHLRGRGLVPSIGAPPLSERHIRIIWASWHVTTVFGWMSGIVLLRLASPAAEPSLQVIVENMIAVAFLGCSLLVLVGTKGRHPGWIGLFGVAALIRFI